MRQVFLKKDGTERLLLFFAGWGMDERPFLDLNPSCDFMVCFDYLSMDFDAGLVRSYDRIDVVAWSMGVFAASRLDVLDRLAVFSSTAFNGTLYPIDDRKGIPECVFTGTLRNISPDAMSRFDRRMCNKSSLQIYRQNHPGRTIDSLREELFQISQLCKSACAGNTLSWNHVYIGDSDLIIPTANQKAAWQDYGYNILKDCGHYSHDVLKWLIEDGNR